MMGMGEKPRNIQKYENRKQRKNSPFGCRPIPRLQKWRPTVFRFSIASDFDPKLMPKIQNQITMRKVCIVIQSLVSRRPNHHSGYS